MRVIIPAAGCGRRLLPRTEQVPKCLVPVGGVSILERLLAQLAAVGVDDVVCVVGHGGELVERRVSALARRPRVTFVPNDDYERSNSIVSVLATSGFWTRDFAIVDSDVLVSTRLLRRVLGGRGDAVVVDTARDPAAIDMAVELRRGAVWHLDKELPRERIGGEAVPLSRWTVAGGAELARVMTEMVAAGATDVWYQFAIGEVAKRKRVAPIYSPPGDWAEIDCADDLLAANAAHLAGAGWATA